MRLLTLALLFVSLVPVAAAGAEVTPVEDPAWVPERPAAWLSRAEGSAPLAYPTVRFRWPLRKQDWFHTVNYVDLDPSAAFSDWNCTAVSYDGHTGNDLILRDFTEQDQGRWVLAAADGVVTYVVDGYFDRNTFPTGRSNYILVEHSDGTQSWYYHNRKWSSRVTVGQQVFEGQPLALVGSSGPSSWPHLHFQVTDIPGTVYEPYSGSCQTGASLWQPPQRPHVSLGTPVLYDSAVRATPPAYEDIVAKPAATTHIRQVSPGGTQMYYWVKLSDVHAGDTWNVTFKRPNGTIQTTFGDTFTSFQPNPWFWTSAVLPAAGSNGTWSVEWKLNNVLQATTTFVYDAVAYASPVATGRTIAVTRGAAVADLRATDADGGIQSFAISTPPAHGELMLSGVRNATFTYTPAPGFSGTDTFQFQATDSQGAVSAPATMTMSVTPTVENALRLEDAGDYVAVPYGSALDFASAFTIEAWIRRDGGSAEWQRIFDRRANGTTDSFGYSLHLLWDNHLYFSIGTGTAGWYAYGSTAIPLRQWTHVAVTWDGSTIRLYVNGKEEAFPSFFPGPVSYAGVGEARIGGTHYSTLEECWRGEIQEVRVWSVARTATDLQNGMACSFFENALPATVKGRWRLKGDAVDSSTSGLHGTLVGGASFVHTDSGVPTSCAALDLDSDGILDAADKCPLTASASQADADADGVGDVCDVCSSKKDPKQIDTDGDTVGDACDNCPFLGNLEQADGDLDGSGDVCDPSPAVASVGVPSPNITLSMSHNKTSGVSTIAWNAEALSSSYEVYRATSAMVRSGFYGTCQNTRDGNVLDTTFSEDQAPAPGGVYYYLILGVSSSGTRGLAGTDSDNRQRDLRAGDCL